MKESVDRTDHFDAIQNEVCQRLSDGNEPGDLVSLSKRLVARDGRLHSILNQIAAAPEGQTVVDHAEVCVGSYRALYRQIHEYLNAFRQILEALGSESAQNEAIVERTIQAVNAVGSRPREILVRIAKSVAELCGNPANPDVDQIVEQLLQFSKRVKSERESLTDLQKVFADFELNLAKVIEIPKDSKRRPSDVIRLILKTLHNRQIDAKLIRTIHFRLAALLHLDPKKEYDIPKMFDMMEQNIRRQRFVIESIASKVANCRDLSLETLPLLSQIDSQIQGQQPQAKVTGLDEMFSSVFDLIPLTTRSDYRVYVPEVCTAFISLHNSVMSLKPFASTLNNIFTQFDGKFASFSPGSKSHQFLKNQLYALHCSLNSLSPSKINSLVFLVVSRFIALFSSFLSTLAALSFDGSNPEMKQEFFRLDQLGLQSPPPT
jgi:hypothetical protein